MGGEDGISEVIEEKLGLPRFSFIKCYQGGLLEQVISIKYII